jgi:hypothetical protein
MITGQRDVRHNVPQVLEPAKKTTSQGLVSGVTGPW